MSPLLSPLVPALGWALVDFLWQGALVGVATFAVLATLRDARPQSRYAVLLVAMLACVILPAAGVVRALTGGDGSAGSVPSTGATMVIVGFEAGATQSTDWRATVQANLPRMVSAWSLGAALLALRFALGLAWVGRLRTGGRPPDFAWQARLERLAAAVGLAHPPELRLVEGLEGPAVAGWWRPVVLMPAALLARMPADLLEALLAHELAHVRRHDYLVNLLQGAVEALLFYHPVVWWLSRRLRIEREQVADDLALRAIGEPRQLARALQCLDQLQADAAGGRAPAHPHLAPAAHGGQLMNRIRRLVRPRPAGLHWKSGLPLIAISAMGLAVYVQAAPRPMATPASAPTAVVAPAAAVASVAPVAVVAPVPSIGATAAAPAALAAPAAAPVPAFAPVAASIAAQAADADGEHHRWAWNGGEPYALVRAGKDEMLLSGDMDDMAAVKRTRNHLRGDFLWFRRDGQAYVVQDPALLGAARQAWAPAEAQARKLEALSAKMQPHAARLEQLGKQMEAAHAKDAPERERLQALAMQMEPIAREQQAIAERMRDIGERMRDAGNERERERLSAQMEALAGQMRPLNDQASDLGGRMGVMGSRMSASHEPLKAISEQMREASAPMKELGEQMKVLGEEQGRLSRAADASVRTVIDRALREGKAERSDRISAY
jgi:beta-lactamase regulating signal transducer with metallopeptidase domain/predicted  nucleic acid-binding Zn-ribbon protein